MEIGGPVSSTIVSILSRIFVIICGSWVSVLSAESRRRGSQPFDHGWRTGVESTGHCVVMGRRVIQKYGRTTEIMTIKAIATTFP